VLLLLLLLLLLQLLPPLPLPPPPPNLTPPPPNLNPPSLPPHTCPTMLSKNLLQDDAQLPVTHWFNVGRSKVHIS
jgi:hypothetical protein